ncbi:hypothetical protein ACFV6F_21875 [Kitasatospora phosalacinea]|uniref:hypothetical protein n=1 Tax=Kitasatospora phosalacinea TaxID=2065 RepID=UPI00365F82B2
MATIEVPGPEPDWEEAPSYQGGKRNPAFQQSLLEHALGTCRAIAGLQVPLEPLAARLRLVVERGWEDLGYASAAMFMIGRTCFGLSRTDGDTYTLVHVDRAVTDHEAALATLFAALGIDSTALAFRGTPEDGFEYCNGWTG